MKKKIISALLTIPMIISLASCGSRSQSGSTTASSSSAAITDDYAMQIPLSNVMCSAPMSVALLNGYFDEEGLKYQTYKSDGSTDFDALVSGKNDVIYALLPTLVQRMSNGLELDMVMGVHYGCINMVASKISGITSIDQLKGKKIGVPGIGSDPCVLLQRVLKAHNIGATADNMEVDILAFNDSDLGAALEKGQVDAIISWDPFATQVADVDGNVMIFQQSTDEQTKDEYCCMIGLRPEFVSEHSDEAAKFCTAIQKACDYIAQNPADAAKLIIDNGYCGCNDVDLTTKLLTTYNYKAQVQAGKDSFEKCTQDLTDLGIISIDKTAAEFTEDAFVTIPNFNCQ